MVKNREMCETAPEGCCLSLLSWRPSENSVMNFHNVTHKIAPLKNKKTIPYLLSAKDKVYRCFKTMSIGDVNNIKG